MNETSISKIIVLAGLMIIIGTNALSLAAGRSLPFVKVGTVKTLAPTDNFCTIIYKKRRIFVANFYGGPATYFYVMNLNGRETRLLPLDRKMKAFKASNMRIFIEWKKRESVPPEGQIGLDGDIFREVKVTFRQGKEKFTLSGTGGCEGGADYGL
jgi:hypothetical protein